jgi:hypothetical protein
MHGNLTGETPAILPWDWETIGGAQDHGHGSAKLPSRCCGSAAAIS